MKKTLVFEDQTSIVIKNGVEKPLTLVITVNKSESPKGNAISIRGLKNPFPFKEAIITESTCGLVQWIEKNTAYHYVGEFWL